MSALARIARFGRPLAPRLALAVLAGVCAAGAAIGLMATSAWLLSRAAQQPPILYLMVAITAVRAFGISRGAFRYLERLAAHDAAFRVLRELRLAAYVRLERLAPNGLEAYRSGDLLARLVADVDGLADLWLRVLLPYGVALVAGAAAALLVGLLVPAAGATLAVTMLAVAAGAPLLLSAFTRRAERTLAPARGELAAAALDLLNGGPELLAAGVAPDRVAALASIDTRLASAESRAAAGNAVAALVSSAGSGAATWLALLFGIAAVRAGTLDGVALAVVVLTPIAAHELVSALIPAAQHVPGLEASAGRVVELLDRAEPVREPDAPATVPDGPLGLVIDGLTARYGADAVAAGRPTAPPALGPLDLAINPGGCALVTGPSGAGKSTLGAVLVRFLEPASGSVAFVDAAGARVPITALGGDDVRRLVGLAPQDPHIFDTSVLENLRLANPDASEAGIRDALGAVRLLDWVDSLPAGLDTLVGEHGARLSGGQRQRLALARILLATHPIVVLDEPTEHLDEPMARDVMAELRARLAGRTLVVLTHRPELMGDGPWETRLDLATAAGAAERAAELAVPA